MILLAFATLLLASMMSCQPLYESSQPQAIIGTNEMTKYLPSDGISQAIGRMAIGCTVTHIGNGIVLTAGHCLYELSCDDPYYDVTWSYRAQDHSKTIVAKCSEILAHVFTADEDYAVLRFETVPAASLPINLIDRPVIGEALTLYSHPNGQALTWSGWCTHQGEGTGNRFRYDCDTEPGSSGAAILNARHEIVGIHNQADDDTAFNAGSYLQAIRGLDAIVAAHSVP